MRGTSLVERFSWFVAGFWWSSLAVTGFIVVPQLFAHLPTSLMAGNMAARLFAIQTGISVLCALWLLMLTRAHTPGRAAAVACQSLVWILGGMLLSLVSQFVVSPHIVARDHLALWHSIGSTMYLVQWLCAGIVCWRLSAPQE
ncbi:DUF4149 domain-containing protein [Brachymonas sp. M4Q-1]|uniref:DUF4149 domain-containing protein n=1 Tax=Brachymonas sp. M4Q-1 TaxID=3416906 RepID=UPI003CF5AA82